ncbi:MAG: DUF2914 domain-containing protein [Elusimicrobia bacterium]|nr:DUF2914 domain-containing protein [Candidatus Obscuribacterium magneticum]
MKRGRLMGLVVLGLGLATLGAQEAVAPAVSPLRVDLKIGTGIENREPVGVAETFGEGMTQLVGWTYVRGATEPTEITHVWSCDGKEMMSVSLQVKSSSYRTWSRKNVSGMRGMWTIEVKDVSGKILAKKEVLIAAETK